MRISDWSSDVCSSDLLAGRLWRPALDARAALYLPRGDGARACPRRLAVQRQYDRPDHRDIRDRCAEAALSRAYRQHRRLVVPRSEEHTSELQSLMRISYAVFCLKKKNIQRTKKIRTH